MDLLEETRREYLEQARQAARSIAIGGDGTCSVDEVREVCPPPVEVDGRVMGAIFNNAEWDHAGYERSNRVTCHKRPISRFKLAGFNPDMHAGAIQMSAGQPRAL